MEVKEDSFEINVFKCSWTTQDPVLIHPNPKQNPLIPWLIM